MTAHLASCQPVSGSQGASCGGQRHDRALFGGANGKLLAHDLRLSVRARGARGHLLTDDPRWHVGRPIKVRVRLLPTATERVPLHEDAQREPQARRQHGHGREAGDARAAGAAEEGRGRGGRGGGAGQRGRGRGPRRGHRGRGGGRRSRACAQRLPRKGHEAQERGVEAPAVHHLKAGRGHQPRLAQAAVPAPAPATSVAKLAVVRTPHLPVRVGALGLERGRVVAEGSAHQVYAHLVVAWGHIAATTSCYAPLYALQVRARARLPVAH
mmetsp:Transcript_93456/g.273635  ORF Transcript_93456/g.273635 Transcript_93456/m.273635 type:complete len:269 (-) Transcript_93456:561-1367(-)